jgi:hypothetical protein
VATYRFDTLGLLQSEPTELDDGTLLHELRAPGASRAGLSVRTEPAAADAGGAVLGPDELLVDHEPCELAGAPAIRTLVLVQLGGLATVVLEQWRLVAAGERWLVTATADLALWPRLAPPLRAAVASLEVGP